MLNLWWNIEELRFFYSLVLFVLVSALSVIWLLFRHPRQ